MYKRIIEKLNAMYEREAELEKELADKRRRANLLEYARRNVSKMKRKYRVRLELISGEGMPFSHYNSSELHHGDTASIQAEIENVAHMYLRQQELLLRADIARLTADQMHLMRVHEQVWAKIDAFLQDGTDG